MELRPYQRDAVDAIYKYFSENNGNPLIVVPTGGGKSLIIANFLREAIFNWPDTRVI
ncbi:MAG: DNA helicase, partial [Methylocystaceae bacterium]|nr:DNA helicase [Methylocystaceae bacterium]